MKVILSPSKTQNLSCPLDNKGRKLFNEDKSKAIMSIFKNMSREEIANIFKIKGKLLDETYALYRKPNKEIRYDPIGFYDGVVYEKLCKKNYDKAERKYLEDNLVIFSAMFGILEAGMGMWPYRLDFKVKVPNLNLYNYWRDDILGYFKDEEVIINLASKEFSSILKSIDDRVINIHFLEPDGRVLSFKAKKARGLMADRIVELKIGSVEELKDIIIEGYRYSVSKSNSNNYYYIKEGE